MSNELPKFDELKVTVKQSALPAFKELTTVAKTTSTPEGQKVVGMQYGGHNPKKPKVGKRVNLAQGLDTFKKSFGQKALFYRYIRLPDVKNYGLPGPKGGACILVSLRNSDVFDFAFSICSSEDTFIKDQSRVICQQRYKKGEICRIARRDLNASCYENILRAITNYLTVNSTGVHNTLASEPTLEPKSLGVTSNNLKKLAGVISDYYVNSANENSI